jgi:hypothetical protein
MTDVSILGAVLAGLVSFLSPCVLPLVPGYVSMLSGIGMEQLRQGQPPRAGLFATSLAFVAGFSFVFISFGASASAVGQFLRENRALLAPVAGSLIPQQARFDEFIEIFNNERPHEALGMKCPVEVYQPSIRTYRGLPDIDYPFHDKVIVVTNCGRICLGRKKINFSTVFAGQAVGIKEVHEDIWLVSFMDYDLGYFDLETRVLEPFDNPFGPKLLPM